MSTVALRSIWAGGLAAAMTFGSGANAQDAAWNYAATVYLFMAETTTGIAGPGGSVESTLSFGDAVSNLDFAFMGTFEANNGQWGVIGDYMYTDLSFSGETPGPAFTGADTSVKTQVFSGYLTYRVLDDANVDVDLGAGFRWFSADAGITLTGGPTPAPSRSFDDSWIDPLIAARVNFRIAPRWIGTAAVDYGGFSRDSETWQVLLTAGYEINENWVVRGGYRYLKIDQTINGTDFSFSQSGPVLGVSYRF
jgi:opacity protein-like surface antigen